MLVEIDAHFGRAPDDVLAFDGARECFVLQFLSDTLCIHFGDVAAGLYIRARGEKTGELIAAVERFLEQANAGNSTVIRMGKDGTANFFVNAALGEHRLAFHRMIGGGRVDFPIEVVEKRRYGPFFFVFAEPSRIGGDARFNGKHVAAKAIRFYELAHGLPRLVARH